MDIIEYYIELRLTIPFILDHVPTPITIKEVSQSLHCTERNAKYLLRKMDAENLITWEPGKGRGNRSKITCHFALPSVIFLYFNDLMKQKKADQALELINRPEIPMEIRKHCFDHLRSQFGLQTIHATKTDSTKQASRLPKGITLNHMVRNVNVATSSWTIKQKTLKHSVVHWPIE